MAEFTTQTVLEAALLAARKPLSIREMRRLFSDELSAKTVRQELESLRVFWENRAMVLEELSDGTWRFRTAEGAMTWLARIEEERPARYSRAAMETLAIIAYRQPVTRGDIEEIRGVAVNPNVLRQLQERGWVEVVGRRESPGRPELFATTRQFLDDLGLKSLADLPPLSGDMPQSKEFELVFGDEPSEEKDKTAESAEGVADRPQERAETE